MAASAQNFQCSYCGKTANVDAGTPAPICCGKPMWRLLIPRHIAISFYETPSLGYPTSSQAAKRTHLP
jgi:hypothetical protein